MSEPQMGEMFQYWTKTQKTWFENFFGATQNFAESTGTQWWQEEYKRYVDASERLLKTALTSQVEIARTWADNVGNNESTPPIFNQWVKQSQQKTEEYVGMQARMWDMFFSNARNVEVPAFFAATAAKTSATTPTAEDSPKNTAIRNLRKTVTS